MARETLYRLAKITAEITKNKLPKGVEDVEEYIDKHLFDFNYDIEYIDLKRHGLSDFSTYASCMDDVKTYCYNCGIKSNVSVSVSEGYHGSFYSVEQYMIEESVYDVEPGEEPDFYEGSNFDRCEYKNTVMIRLDKWVDGSGIEYSTTYETEDVDFDEIPDDYGIYEDDEFPELLEDETIDYKITIELYRKDDDGQISGDPIDTAFYWASPVRNGGV